MATSEKKSKVSIIIIAVLAVVAVGLSVVLAITYGSRYEEGVKVGKAEQIEVIKADIHRGVIPELTGQNASQVGYWLFGDEESRIHIHEPWVSLPISFKTSTGELIDKEAAKNYKIVSQEPKAGTAFDVVYEKNSDGGEDTMSVASMGVQGITLTLEKIK